MILNGTQIGRFQIEKPLSETGGMASVFLASHVENPNLMAAIKIARTDSTGTSAEDILLQREAELLGKWDWRYSGFVRLYPLPRGGAFGYTLRATEVTNQPWYMVMEYLRGYSLAQNLKKIEKYPFEWKVELFYQILCSVSFLHQKGYAHRDLKPDNIVFREPVSVNAIPQPVLVDFALATDGKENYSVVEQSLTLEYSSPEVLYASMGIGNNQLMQDPLPSDIWSLGTILYEIMTGKPLFKGDQAKIKTAIIKEQLEPQLAGDDTKYHLLAAFIRPMIKHDPARRPTIKQIILALEEKFLPPRICI
jgi:serine/threonine protein kinase